MNAHDNRPVVILGAGPTGLLCALMLARRNLPVSVYERGADPRSVPQLPQASHSIVLSTRGIEALRRVDLAEVALSGSVAVRGRKMHGLDGTQTFQEYGADGQCTYAMPRDRLRAALLDATAEYGLIELHFDHTCVDVDLDGTRATFEHAGRAVVAEAQLVIGADGVRSRARQALQGTDRFDFSQQFLDFGYQEVPLGPKADGSFALDKHAVHVWPRHDFVMTALPNPNGTFTATLFLPFEGEHSFATLQTPEAIEAFFQEQFPDAWALAPQVGEVLAGQPPRSLCTVRCAPLHRGRVVLIGDAAHAMVPFYGQGLNCSLEDCQVLEGLLEEHAGDWEAALRAYSTTRKPDLEAIAELALASFRELRSLVARPSFLWRKRLEKTLHRMMPDHFIPLYTMVTFSTMPYSEARRRAIRQEEWLLEVFSSARTT